MANIKSSIKSIRQEKKIRVANHAKMATLRTKIKVADEHLDVKTQNDVNSYADNLEAKHVIHKNKANRIKSRLAKRINKNKQEVKLG